MNATTKLVWLIASYQPVDHMNSELENAIFLMIYFISWFLLFFQTNGSCMLRKQAILDSTNWQLVII